MKKVLAFVLAAAMAFPLAGCGGSGATASSGDSNSAAVSGAAPAAAGDVKGKTVVFIPKLTGNAFFESANTGAQKYSADWGFTVNYQGSPNAAVADQVQVVNNAIAAVQMQSAFLL